MSSQNSTAQTSEPIPNSSTWVSRMWAAAVARLHPAAPIAGLVQADMTAAHQYAGDEALQLGSNHVSQTAGCCAVQRAGVSAVQAAGRSALQIAGDYARQGAGHHAMQYGGHTARQVAGARAYQTARTNSSQTAGEHSTQVVGNDSFQIAGVGTLQITRWDFAGENCTAMRIVGVAEAGKRYHVCEGTWTLIEY